MPTQTSSEEVTELKELFAKNKSVIQLDHVP